MTLSRTVLCILAGLTLAALGASAGAAADRLAQIEAARTLRVCIWPDYYGVSFRNPKTQQLTGFDVDNATDLARTLGVAVQFVDSSFARFSDDLLAERCDIAMFGIAPTPARLQKLRFAQPHMASDIVAVTTKGNRLVQRWSDIDRPGIVVAVVRGSLHETVMAERLQHATLRVLDTAQAREQEVLAGRADLLTADVPYTRRLLDHSEWARLVVPPAPFHVTPYAWAMRPGDDRFHERVERALADFKRDGRLAANARRYGLEQTIVTK
jgi:cyclohexadienyl dehydratase